MARAHGYFYKSRLGEGIKQLSNCFPTRKQGARSRGEKFPKGSRNSSELGKTLLRHEKPQACSTQGAQIAGGSPALEAAGARGTPRRRESPHPAHCALGTVPWPPVTPLDSLEGSLSKQPITQPRGGPWEGVAPPISSSPAPRGHLTRPRLSVGLSMWSGDGMHKRPIRGKRRGVSAREGQRGWSRARRRSGRRSGHQYAGAGFPLYLSAAHASALAADVGTFARPGTTSATVPSDVS